MDYKHYLNWIDFLSGEWTLDKPTIPGKYFTSPKDGLSWGIEAVCYLDPETKEPKLVKSWGGYFWSKPIPELQFTLVESERMDNLHRAYFDLFASVVKLGKMLGSIDNDFAKEFLHMEDLIPKLRLEALKAAFPKIESSVDDEEK